MWLVGADNVTLKQNTIRINNFVGIATVSTLVLGSLAGIPPAGFADIKPNRDGVKITQNIVRQNGLASPAGLPWLEPIYYRMVPAQTTAGKIMFTLLHFLWHCRLVFNNNCQ